MGKNSCVLAGFLFLVIFAPAPTRAQTNTSSPTTNGAPATSGTNAPTATLGAVSVPLANVVTEAVSDSGQLQQIQQSVVSDPTESAIKESLPILTGEIDRRKEEDDRALVENPSLSALQTAQASWQMLSNSLADSKQSLASRIAELDGQLTNLGQMNGKWQETLVQSTGAPPAILDRIHAVIGSIAQTTGAVTDLRTRLLSLQNSVAEEGVRISTALAAIQKARATAVTQLFRRDSAPLWDFTGLPGPVGAANSLATQVAELRAYVAEKFPTFFIHLALFLVFAGAFFWTRGELSRHVGDDPEVQQAATVFEMPLAPALILALLVGGWLYPLAPPLFLAGLGAAAVLPTVLILRRLIEPALHPVLFALFISYFVDQVRLVATGASWTGRLLFLAELVTACVFLVWLLPSEKLAGHGPDRKALLEKFVQIYARLALVPIAVAVAANILGYVRLSYLLGNGMLKSSYLLVILYAAVRIVDGLVVGALKLPPFSLLGSVRRHDGLLRRRIWWTLRAAALLFWEWETLEIFSVRAALWNRLSWVLNYQVPFGSLDLSLAPLICFGATIWITILLSKFLRFVLEEEVYPKLRLGRGVPYAASTLVHYTVLVIGIIFALATMGIDLRQYTVLAGALGVGLGFGLQNIMNNFVSGIILLFERPIKVGDVIQVDTNIGTVESIGIRASVIRVTNGSELILPNGNLISNPVTNWTFSNRQRVIDLPVAVAAKSDPHQVMALLVETAKAHPLVLKDPPPQVLLIALSGAALNLELRAWTNSNESWQQVRSDLALAISAALARENIAMS
jgi:potassium efflux system protein